MYTERNANKKPFQRKLFDEHLNGIILLPRKLLNYRTPLEVFLEEVNKIVDLDTVQFHIAI